MQYNSLRYVGKDLLHAPQRGFHNTQDRPPVLGAITREIVEKENDKVVIGGGDIHIRKQVSRNHFAAQDNLHAVPR